VKQLKYRIRSKMTHFPKYGEIVGHSDPENYDTLQGHLRKRRRPFQHRRYTPVLRKGESRVFLQHGKSIGTGTGKFRGIPDGVGDT
jgi:hypothetical protein